MLNYLPVVKGRKGGRGDRRLCSVLMINKHNVSSLHQCSVHNVIKLLEAIRKGKKWKQGLKVTESYAGPLQQKAGFVLF